MSVIFDCTFILICTACCCVLTLDLHEFVQAYKRNKEDDC